MRHVRPVRISLSQPGHGAAGARLTLVSIRQQTTGDYVIDAARRIKPRPSILIVDGDADARMLYRTLRTAVARRILEAEDGVEALRTAVCTQPDADIARAERAGADAVLVKPFLPDALGAAAFRSWRHASRRR